MITNRRYHIRRRNVSENLCGLNLKKLRSQNCQKMAKIGPFFSFPEKKYLLKHSHMPKNASVIIRFTLSQMDKNCRVQVVKSAENWSNIDYNWQKNDLNYEFNFFVCVVGYLQKQKIGPGILSGCDEACLGMLKVLSNELAISQE